jgi:hypothetical protein
MRGGEEETGREEEGGSGRDIYIYLQVEVGLLCIHV